MNELVSIVGNNDYQPINSNLERKIIIWLFKKIVKKGNFYLDFDDKKVQISNDSSSDVISICPPNLAGIIRISLNLEYQILETYAQGKWLLTNNKLLNFLLLLVTQDNFIYRLYRFRELTPRLFYIHKQLLRAHKEVRKCKRHYNLPSEFYQGFLNKSMLYSCAFFDSNHTTLEQAQQNKIITTIKRLNIDKDNMQVLDIGCGWGTLVKHIASNYKANVVGISIAKNQIDFANKLKKRFSGDIAARISYLCADYANFLTGKYSQFDRIVSIGMLEHVGKRKYNDFFKQIARLLKPAGIAVIHTITKHEKGFSSKWIDKYIFPGGYVPTCSEVIQSAEKNRLITGNIYFHEGINYVKTLQAWSNNFITNFAKNKSIINEIVAKNHPKLQGKKLEVEIRRFIRMWYTYLNAIQTIFLPNNNKKPMSVNQFIFKKI